MFTPDRSLEPPIDDSDEVTVDCCQCGKEHSIHNSNKVEVTASTDMHDKYEQWCNECVNKYK